MVVLPFTKIKEYLQILYKCSDGKIKTVLETTKYSCPINDNEKDKKETITIIFDTKDGSKIDRYYHK